jgi:hypothetical protein
VAAMAKETQFLRSQFLRRQAKKAELMAKAISDIEASQSSSASAKAKNRSQAELPKKAKKKSGKKSGVRDT